MSGHAELEAFIAGVESLRRLNERTAKAAEADILAEVRKTAAAGQTPSGDPWPPLADGGKPLAGAAKAISSSVKGARIDLKIGPPWVYHHHGAGGSSQTKEAKRHRQRAAARHAKGGTKSKFHAPKRQIIPDPGDPIPPPMKAAIVDAATRVFEKAVG